MQPKVYTSSDHHIHNDLVDPNALFVLKKLHEAGHEAYLVGGGVRDLLMRKKPKDFDISTSAHPEQIKPLFRRCLLIGRRFRLAHVRFGKQIIEVATFRAGDPEDESLILRDNIFGTAEQDVMRRDFTINGLYYNPENHEIIDYVGGFQDLKNHMLTVIGDPEIRFKQDPVRMIRMQKFRARFGFHVESKTMEALLACREEIAKSSPPRVIEEILRMLESGAAEPFFHLLTESKILHTLFPNLALTFESELGKILYAYLKTADSINQKSGHRPLDRSILIALLIFPILEQKIAQDFLAHKHIPHIGEVIDLTHDLIDELIISSFSQFPKKIRLGAHTICQMQYRLTPFDKKRKLRTRIMRQKEFHHALTFLKLRSLIHPPLSNIYTYWKEVTQRKENRP